MIDYKKPTRPIGQRFKLGKIWLEVKKEWDCQLCHFFRKTAKGMKCIFLEGDRYKEENKRVGWCGMEARTDHKDVVFCLSTKPRKPSYKNEYTRKILQTRGRTIHVPRRGA